MKKEIMQKQQKIALLVVLWRIPGLIAALAAALASRSIVLWMEVIEILSIMIPGMILVLISRKLSQNLKYQFNYGTGKVEAVTAFCCEVFDIAGLFCVLFFAIRGIVKPEASESEDELLFALVVSLVGVLVDLFVLKKEKMLSSNEQNRMFHTAYLSAQKEFAFDFIAIATLIVSIVFYKTAWIVYFSPVVCILMAIPFTIIIAHHMHSAVLELVDLTLDEESQLKIIKVLNEFYDSYENLGDVKSRINGKYKNIDIGLQFRPDMPYEQVRTTTKKIQERINEEIGECSVNINII